MIKTYNCKNCKKVLFEGEFTGTIIKNCPKCKKVNTFVEKNFVVLDKFCNNKLIT